MQVEYEIPSSEAMTLFAAHIAEIIQPGDLVFLRGCLGAGKTTWARGFLEALSIDTPIKSPTYTLVETYETSLGLVHHFDLYRLHHGDELHYMGIDDYFDEGAIGLIEWPERGGDVLPDPVIEFDITMTNNEQKRLVRCRVPDQYSDQQRFKNLKEWCL